MFMRNLCHIDVVTCSDILSYEYSTTAELATSVYCPGYALNERKTAVRSQKYDLGAHWQHHAEDFIVYVGVRCHFHCKNSICQIKRKTKTSLCFGHKKSSSHFGCRDSRWLCGTGRPDGGRGVCPHAGSMFNSVWGTNKVMPKVNPSLQTIIIVVIIINIKITTSNFCL